MGGNNQLSGMRWEKRGVSCVHVPEDRWSCRLGEGVCERRSDPAPPRSSRSPKRSSLLRIARRFPQALKANKIQKGAHLHMRAVPRNVKQRAPRKGSYQRSLRISQHGWFPSCRACGSLQLAPSKALRLQSQPFASCCCCCFFQAPSPERAGNASSPRDRLASWPSSSSSSQLELTGLSSTQHSGGLCRGSPFGPAHARQSAPGNSLISRRTRIPRALSHRKPLHRYLGVSAIGHSWTYFRVNVPRLAFSLSAPRLQT